VGEAGFIANLRQSIVPDRRFFGVQAEICCAATWQAAPNRLKLSPQRNTKEVQDLWGGRPAASNRGGPFFVGLFSVRKYL
jgi:hypothetical protein